MLELEPRLVHAPELFGNYWFNTLQPISLRENLGNVLLVDFWDYSCINCIRTLPYVSEWHRRYAGEGLVVVGVHTPEFRFGQERANVEQAIKGFKIRYAVVADNEARVWSAFANRYWPTRYLIDKNGYIRFSQHGEGGYQQFERAIQSLLLDAGYRGELPDLMEPLRDTDETGAVCYRSTGEMQAGYLRSSLGNVEGVIAESPADFVDPKEYLDERFYVGGRWYVAREYMRHDGPELEPGTVALRYEAFEANAVLSSSTGRLIEIEIHQDGKPLAREYAGSDVIVTNEGQSILFVDKPRMYQLVKNPLFGGHELTLRSASPGLEVFAFSFVSCAIPDTIGY
jgi:thiol-disulfide isomerase/thioredoxin